MEVAIINSVREHPCVYDKSLSEYRDSEAKNDAWRMISDVTGYSVNECRDTWTKLRNRLVHAIKRRMRKPSICSSKWLYEEQMEFLVPFIQVTSGEDDCIPSRKHRKRHKMECLSPQLVQQLEYDAEPEETYEELEEEQSEAEDTEDVDLFYQSVAGTVKKLPRAEQLGLRMRVCELLGEAQLRCHAAERRDAARKRTLR